ncbi:hypothetical protein CcaverHIS002_0605210 [Cutaneotrichosporon cavernicola]|uniref:BZIP domain-containing protein n=1 Tax=Cutaneotrichosporon cavernicola TaxID=279322 RepID=A0AA48QY22_9TREE|nr:uncharacterized protein CcaverHIS019_0604660 [Cutaneotrichosporon cavernicola]BEI86234.1 hypothetical protein CcaverHIS002_0605210 [Cutaneotrichosporon cavernicola]BEI94007.1 hypothetical protein CcaverHIS019_0604660 [Cutaneotrichosporon cavernicola]BEJ01787.1 hypothetical protein CcaverHIS631_0604690 [Cutaneotrichosporon cavernicola]
MEPTNWGLYGGNYYGGERQHPMSPPHQGREDHRRSINQGTFLPPLPPSQSSPHNLPPVSSAYGSGYHGSSPSGVGLPTSTAGPSAGQGPSGAPMHMTPMNYSSHMPTSQPMSGYHYPVQPPPATMSSLPPAPRPAQPHGYSPRIPGGYPTASPGMTTLSPLSPSNHLTYTGASSSSSFPPGVHPTHAKMETSFDKKRRTNSAGSSWEGSGAMSVATTIADGGKDKGETQPWGMPQDQYKALNPRDKKQVRNRIGARRFRAKRKDYVSALESEKKESEAVIKQLQTELDTARHTINELRARLHLPPIPLPPPVETGLGLDVSTESYQGGTESRDPRRID